MTYIIACNFRHSHDNRETFVRLSPVVRPNVAQLFTRSEMKCWLFMLQLVRNLVVFISQICLVVKSLRLPETELGRVHDKFATGSRHPR